MLKLAVFLCLGFVSVVAWAADGIYRPVRIPGTTSHAQNLVLAAAPLKTSETKEALAFAANYLKSHLSRCGKDIFIKLRGGYEDRGYRGTPFGGIANTYQLLEPRIAVQPLRAITDIDKLNGLQWSGWIVITAKAARPLLISDENEKIAEWGEWYDATKPRRKLVAFGIEVDEASKSPVVKMELEKRHGEWTIGPWKLAEPLRCGEMPQTYN